MTDRMRAVTFGVLLLIGAVFLQLNNLTVFSSEQLVNHPANQRTILREFGEARGPLVVAGEAIVQSTPADGTFAFLRQYQDGALYAHITGYYSLVVQRSGLEAALNDTLRGTPTELINQNLAGLFGRARRPGNAVELTIDPRVQAAARDALGQRMGAVVVVNPRTGAVLASYANPTFNPAPLAQEDRGAVSVAWQQLLDDPARPLVDRATAETYPPGSVFKLLVAAAALDQGMSPDAVFDDVAELAVPGTSRPINNFPPGPCTSSATISLTEAFVRSCNTVFVELALTLREPTLRRTAEQFGFNRRIPYELPIAASVFPEPVDTPALAQSALGQRDVRVTALHAALMAASVVNDGLMPEPYVVAQVRNPNGRVLIRNEPQTAPQQAMSPQTARQLETMMVETVTRGTGRAARLPGRQVGGKTGTAETPGTPTVWFVGFLDDLAAIAVVLPDAGEGAQGGRDAAPIARAVLQAVADR